VRPGEEYACSYQLVLGDPQPMDRVAGVLSAEAVPPDRLAASHRFVLTDYGWRIAGH
jgi:hypothetical protein